MNEVVNLIFFVISKRRMFKTKCNFAKPLRVVQKYNAMSEKSDEECNVRGGLLRANFDVMIPT